MTKQSKIQNLKQQIHQVSQEIDSIVLQGGRVGLGDPLTRKYQTLRSKLAALQGKQHKK